MGAQLANLVSLLEASRSITLQDIDKVHEDQREQFIESLEAFEQSLRDHILKLSEIGIQ